MNLLFASEVINGNWAILCFVLMVVCVVYLLDEREEYDQWSVGMRAAFALMILTIGIGILRVSEYAGWHSYRDLYHPNLQPYRIAGGIIGTIGFLLAIKEFSQRLYGDLPWAIAVVLIILFTIFEIAIA